MAMTKGFFVCFLVSSVLLNVALAQDWKFNYGFSVGATYSTYQMNNISSGVSRSSAHTFNGQLSGWVTLSPYRYVGLETGASIMGLGATLNQSEFGNRDVAQRTYWLQIPLHVVGKLPLRDSSQFFLKVGGYVGRGIFGTNDIPDSYTGAAKRAFSFGDTGTQKDIDFGYSVGVGYKLRSGYLIHLGYQRGLNNVASSQAAYEQRNRAYLIGVGYEF